MYYRREGLPEENELVLCTVTNVQYNSVFCKLDEYNNSGMIHISEVSPGRIRNIRDYVQEGKKIVCKILRVDEEKGHIDLSLRRVTENQRRAKQAEIKQQQKAEKLLEYFTKENKLEFKKFYTTLTKKLFEEYEYLHQAFDDVVTGELNLKKYGVEHAELLTELLKDKINPPMVEIKGSLAVKTYHKDGVEAIKKALIAARETHKNNIDIRYLGNGKYRLIVQAEDYDLAEPILEDAVSAVQKIITDKGPGTVAFERQ